MAKASPPLKRKKQRPAPRQVGQVAALLRHPPAVEAVYEAYNALRQQYVLDQVTQAFQSRSDDPAPLYGKTLLDVGCGTSTITQFLALSGAEITAIDPNREALAAAEAEADRFGAPITFIPTKVENMVGKSPRFDVILALDVLEDVPNADKMLWMLRQLLKPGGLLVVSAIDHTPWAWFLHLFLSSRIYHRTLGGNRRYSHFVRPLHLIDLATRHGLKLAHLQRLSFSLLQQVWQRSPRRGTRYLATFAG